MPKSSARPTRSVKPGPTPRWGERSYVSVGWPKEHRSHYEREASKYGLSLNEYVIREMAKLHGLTVPPMTDDTTAEQEQLPLGA